MIIIYDETNKMFKLQYRYDNLLFTVEYFHTANDAMWYYQKTFNNKDDLK